MDRDGVINRERGDYTFRIEDFEIINGVHEALKSLKKAGYHIIVITNQSGISQGLYTTEEMESCHNYLNQRTDGLIDAIYYSPYHPKITESLSRKPNSLLFEKAIARFKIDPQLSWMVGDKERDLIPAKKLGISTILIGDAATTTFPDHRTENLLEACKIIL